MKNKKYTPSLGTISHGTLREEDLLKTFFEEAKRRFPRNSRVVDLSNVLSVIKYVGDDDVEEAFYRSEWVAGAVVMLETLLDTDLPPYWYFGAIEGDGSDLGYWFSRDSFDEACEDGDILKVDDLAEVKFRKLSEDVQYVAVISDHGNISLYSRTGRYLYSLV